MHDDFECFAGIDWATEAHQVCLVERAGVILGERSFAHSGAGLTALCDWLVATGGAPPEMIAVAIEVPHGAVVDTLIERGFAAFSVNPKQLDRFRDRFTVAGAKDDRRDAHVLGDSLRTDRHCFRRLEASAPALVELKEWSRMAEELGRERVRLANRLHEQLRRYYPQALEVTDDVAADWFLDLWARVPTPEKARRARESSIDKLLKAKRIRKIDAAGLLRILRQKPVTVAPGTVEAACAHIRAVAERLRLVNRQIREAHKRIDALCGTIAGEGDDASGQKTEQRDVEILRSLPGIGRIVLAALLAEAPRPLRDRDYHALRSLSGVAPVTRSSGKRRVVVMRKACHMRLRSAVYHWARVAIQHDPASRERYAALRTRGHSHGRALRSVADRLLAVACAMLQSQTLYDPNHHEKTPKAA
ncbi:MAG: IS110 family transposase [Pseudomonadota bacterium]|nr:IS110 family transposase [Pseudomonadota bacterium]